ncbi:hypothetical protein FHT44_004909 [Mycolicibacterium sp. BK634]|uniref:helix-turn-helix transcriptional regulator n=1 Tax=Mycolicibacterium sp. BK634 TaxID=2587099 RepID=UPI001622B137|nr:helix-turn-helix transcriptional regulator [Mycolicibacterium sp. BK634]MBB3752397.1 hypothetical protein [Mycolicibacterium sp. BK634]
MTTYLPAWSTPVYPQLPPFQWNAETVARVTADAGMNTRHDLARRLFEVGVTRNTVYRTFDPDWNGEVSPTVLRALAHLFNVSLDDLVQR